MAVALNERGLFSWSEWAQALGAEIAAGSQEAGNAIYFENWLRTLETLLVAKGAGDRKADLVRHCERLARRHARDAAWPPHRAWSRSLKRQLKNQTGRSESKPLASH